MRHGISTSCLYPMDTKESLRTLAALDFTVFEVFFNTVSELKPAYLNQMKACMQEHQARIKSIHPFTSGFESALIFTNYYTRFLDGLEFYKKYFQAANILGAEILVIHGQNTTAKHSGISTPEFMEKYAALYELGQSFGITVAQENVNGFKSQKPDFITEIRKGTNDNCAFVFDIKQAVRANVNPFEMVKAMGNKIVHVHVNDNLPGKDCLLPGHGAMDFKQLNSLLQENNYQGDFIIEVYRSNFNDLTELQGAYKIVKDAFTDTDCKC